MIKVADSICGAVHKGFVREMNDHEIGLHLMILNKRFRAAIRFSIKPIKQLKEWESLLLSHR